MVGYLRISNETRVGNMRACILYIWFRNRNERVLAISVFCGFDFVRAVDKLYCKDCRVFTTSAEQVCVCVCVCVYHNSASLLIKILGCECIHDGLCFADCLFYCSSCCWKMAQHVKGKKHRIVLGLQPAASRKAKRKVDAANDATEKGEGQPPRGAAVVTEANTSATSSKSTVKSVAVSLDQPQPQPKAKAGKTNVQPETQSENSATVAVPAGVAKAKTRKKKKRKRKREAREIGT